MRLRNISGSRERIAQSPLVVHEPEKLRGRWQRRFGNAHPLRIEIGMGKGKFIHELAARNPGVNYIGIEKYSSVLLRALEKMDELPLSNLLFIRMDAEEITEVFGEGEVDRIYLNFSDPWPKERHARRRLPSAEFLARYERILKRGGGLEFKTDNKALFDFALGELPGAGWEIRALTFDLHHDGQMKTDNVTTEYEEKFSSQGNPIYKYVINRQH